MGLLGNATHREYYQGNDLGNYQFTSLENIINQFMVVYVGDQKIINKTSRIDVAFHAQRALQEFSFDTFKSVKAYQIDVPPDLQMILPHDYVNYTKLSWVDGAGIKHPLFPTSSTSNPYQIWQDEAGEYEFPEDLELVVNGDFSEAGDAYGKPVYPWYRNSVPQTNNYAQQYAGTNVNSNKLVFSHRTRSSHGSVAWGHSMSAWQELDVSDQDFIDLEGTGAAIDMLNGPGVIRLGITTNYPDSNTKHLPDNNAYLSYGSGNGENHLTSAYNLTNIDGEPSYLEWLSADGEVNKELLKINVSGLDVVYVLVVSFQDFITGTGNESETYTATNFMDNVSVKNSRISTMLREKPGNESSSSTWTKYKSGTPSENQNDYQDDTYWPMEGSRFGLDPQHAQANGSYFIDQRLGKIHFSSNISGKTVILDYISDSLGTDGEMQVHKFAEEAMYRYMVHAIVSTSSWGQQLVPRLTKEKFAAVRTAKLRLSNLKLEELTQTLRGKSKQIKH